jgi:hypothetical protein
MFFVNQKYTKETRGPKMSKSVLSILNLISETTRARSNLLEQNTGRKYHKESKETNQT